MRLMLLLELVRHLPSLIPNICIKRTKPPRAKHPAAVDATPSDNKTPEDKHHGNS